MVGLKVECLGNGYRAMASPVGECYELVYVWLTSLPLPLLLSVICIVQLPGSWSGTRRMMGGN